MKVVCIGNALVDKVCLLPNDDILREENLPKGSFAVLQILAEVKKSFRKDKKKNKKQLLGSCFFVL